MKKQMLCACAVV